MVRATVLVQSDKVWTRSEDARDEARLERAQGTGVAGTYRGADRSGDQGRQVRFTNMEYYPGLADTTENGLDTRDGGLGIGGGRGGQWSYR